MEGPPSTDEDNVSKLDEENIKGQVPEDIPTTSNNVTHNATESKTKMRHIPEQSSTKSSMPRQRKPRPGQQNDGRPINEQNGIPKQNPRLEQEQPGGPEFLKFCSDFSRWAGSLACGGIMAILSGVVGNQPRRKDKELLDFFTASLMATFILAVFLVLISAVRPKMPSLRKMAYFTLPLVAGCLVLSVVLATIFLMRCV